MAPCLEKKKDSSLDFCSKFKNIYLQNDHWPNFNHHSEKMAHIKQQETFLQC